MFLFNNYVPEKLSERIFRDLSEKLNSNYFYHNLSHTKRVINSALKIGRNYHLNNENLTILLTASLMHDYGFIKSHIDHEEIGVKLSSKILLDYDYSEKKIQLINKLILVTKPLAVPKDNLESIMRDSDLEYIGSNDFESISEKLKEEWMKFSIVKSDEEFYKKQLEFLSNHKFCTDFMKKNGNINKEKNIIYAKKKLEELTK
tara:strand:+ start:42 stop:650 length:609 start_codon:yes stop_codon:yes gene_type:complete